jgi:hypothetical protein
MNYSAGRMCIVRRSGRMRQMRSTLIDFARSVGSQDERVSKRVRSSERAKEHCARRARPHEGCPPLH